MSSDIGRGAVKGGGGGETALRYRGYTVLMFCFLKSC